MLLYPVDARPPKTGAGQRVPRRRSEVESLLGDSTLARETLGWTPKISFEEMVGEMITTDLQIAREEALINQDREDS